MTGSGTLQGECCFGRPKIQFDDGRVMELAGWPVGFHAGDRVAVTAKTNEEGEILDFEMELLASY